MRRSTKVAMVGWFVSIFAGTSPAAANQSGQPSACPYRFGDAMPAGTFCVYSGRARDDRGRVCDGEMVMIWTSFDGSNSSRSDAVYVASATDPDVVLHARMRDEAKGQGARLIEYTRDDRELPISGKLQLERAAAPHRTADQLVLELAPADTPMQQSGCAVASFRGEFVGVIAAPVVAASLDHQPSR